jgi:DNA-binding XRE family transcriptional regulator
LWSDPYWLHLGYPIIRYARILASSVNLIFRYRFHVLNDALRESISSHIARLLKQERERQKLSLNALAQKAGLARQTVAFIEREVQSPSFDTLLRIAFALDIRLEDVVSRAHKCAKKDNASSMLRR